MAELGNIFRTRTFMFALVLSVLLLITNVLVLPEFGNPANWDENLRVFAPFALVAMASTPAIISGGGGIDLSVGPLASLINVVLVVELLPTAAGNPALAIPILLLLGAGVGLVNGLLIGVLRLQPVIATLCMFFVLGGVVLKIAPEPATPGANWTADLGHMVGPIPGPLLLIIGPALAWSLLRLTPFRRSLYAVGANDVAAFSAGVNVIAVRVLAYVLDGVFAALAGIGLTVFFQTAE